MRVAALMRNTERLIQHSYLKSKQQGWEISYEMAAVNYQKRRRSLDLIEVTKVLSAISSAAILTLYCSNGSPSTHTDGCSSCLGPALDLEGIDNREGAGRIRPQDFSSNESDADCDALVRNPLCRAGCVVRNFSAGAAKLVGALFVSRFRSVAVICISAGADD